MPLNLYYTYSNLRILPPGLRINTICKTKKKLNNIWKGF